MRRALLASVLVLAGAPPARAYVRTTTEAGVPARWNCPSVTLLVYTGQPPSGLTAAQVLQAASGAAAAWTAPTVDCTGLRVSIVAVDAADGPAVNDRANRVVFRRQRWCHEPMAPNEPCYDPAALAITTVAVRTNDGLIVDTDMELNATNGRRWADLLGGGVAAGDTHDLQNTLTHELGHVIGFDHPCYPGGPRPRPRDHRGAPAPDCSAAPQDMQQTTMFFSAAPSDTTKRTLEADDRQAVCDVYPARGGCLDDGDGGGCAMGGGRSGALVWGVAALAGLALWRRWRRRRRA